METLNLPLNENSLHGPATAGFVLGCPEELLVGARLSEGSSTHLCSPVALHKVVVITLADNCEPSALQDT